MPYQEREASLPLPQKEPCRHQVPFSGRTADRAKQVDERTTILNTNYNNFISLSADKTKLLSFTSGRFYKILDDIPHQIIAIQCRNVDWGNKTIKLF